MILDLGNNPITVQLAYPNGSSPITVPVLAFDVQDSHLGSDGLSKTTGTLTIPASPLEAFPEALDPLTNPARFARKCQVIATIKDSTGAIVPHPRGRLRILKVPAPPIGRAPVLEIEVGCLLSLKDLRQPPTDDSGVVLGTLTTRTEIINRLAAKIGLGALVDAIPEWPIAYPVTTEQSYVATMGAIAWDAGYVLWIDNLERLRARKAPTTPTTPSLRVAIGKQDVEVQAIAPDETPVEVVRASGVGPEVSETQNPETVYAIASDEEFNPSEISTTVFLGFGTSQVATLTNTRQPRGRVFPAQYPGSASLIYAQEEDTYTYYDEEDEGLLRLKKTIIRQPRGVIFPTESPGDTTLIDSKEIQVRYTYENDATIRIDTKTYEPAALVLGSAPNYMGQAVRAYGMKLSAWDTERWQRQGRGWVQSSTSRRYKPGETSRASTNYSSSGSSTPPAPERRDEANQGEEKQYSGVMRFPPIAGSVAGEDSRDFEVRYPVSDAHCTEVAKTEGALLHGRQARLNWTLPLRDRFLNAYQPLMVIDWTTPSGTVTRHLTDGMAFIHDPTRGVVSGDSISLGQVLRTTPLVGEPPADGVADAAEYLTPPFAESATVSGTVERFGSLFASGSVLLQTASMTGLVERFGALVAASTGGGGSTELGAIASDTAAFFDLSVAAPITSATLTYVSNGDTNGLFYWIGTRSLTESFSNPSDPSGRALTAVTFSSEGTPGAENPWRMTDRSSVAVSTGNVANSWMRFDVGAGRSLVCNRYVIRSRSTTAGNHPTAFKFQGSNDASTWDDLDTRTGLTYAASTYYPYTVSTSTAYRYFRILQTAVNSSGANRLVLGDLELYGAFT